MYPPCPVDLLVKVHNDRDIYEPDVLILPPLKLMFRAFELCSFDSVKVVILGQDPYHAPGQANGLAFSVNADKAIPPSLRNIIKEYENDIGTELFPDFSSLASRGVLFLNCILTVRQGNAGSHSHFGWEAYTDSVITAISNKLKPVVFMLWGNFAKKKKSLIDLSKHLVLEATHPSPLGANKGGWFGCKHFSQANHFLKENIFT